MKIIRMNWLSSKTKKEYKLLSKVDYKVKLKDFNAYVKEIVKSKNSFIFIFFFLISLYLINYFLSAPYDFLEIKLTKSEAVYLLNARLTNIVTIFSISVSIFIFIVNTIKEIRKNQDIFRITLTETYFYPVLYYSIFLIIINYFISFLANNNTDFLNIKINDEVFIRFTVLFMGLCILQCIWIGYSFYLVYKAYDNNFILKSYFRYIEKEINNLIEYDLQERLSGNIYNSLISTIPNMKASYTHYNKTGQEVKSIYSENMQIKDINIAKLLKVINADKSHDGTFVPLNINSVLYFKSTIFSFVNVDTSSKLKKSFKRIFKTKKNIKDLEYLIELKNNLISNAEQAINGYDSKGFKEVINIMLNIHTHILKTLSDIKYEDNISKFPETTFFGSELKVIDKDNINVYNLYEKISDRNNKAMLIDLLTYIYKIYILSFEKDVIILIDRFKFVIIWMYKYTKFKTELKKITMERIFSYLSEYVRFNLKYYLEQELKETNTEVKKIASFYGRVLYTISELMYEMIQNRDITYFRRLAEHYNQMNEFNYALEDDMDFENEPDENENEVIAESKSTVKKLFMYLNLGVMAWLIELYRINKIELNELNEYLNCFENKYVNPKDKLMSIVNVWSSFRNDYYNFSNWGNELEEIPMNAYSPSYNSTQWLTFYGIIDLINSNYPNESNIEDLDIELIRTFSHRVNEVTKELSSNYLKWNSLFSWSTSESEFKLKIEKYRNTFTLIQTRYNFKILELIALEKLSNNKIAIFKNENTKVWEKFTVIDNLFKLNKNYVKVNIESYQPIKTEILARNYKKMFIDKYYSKIYGSEKYGGLMTDYEKNDLMKLIFNVDLNEKKYSNINDLLNNEIDRLKNDIYANIIFVNNSKLIEKLYSNVDFSHYHSENDGKRIIGFIGVYKNIPIYNLKNESFNDRIAICNFEESIVCKVNTNPEWEKEILNINVRTLTNDEVEDIFNKLKKNNYDDHWFSDYKSLELDEVNIKNVIKCGVKIILEEKIKYELLDKSKLVVYELT